jgi:hypothetical protein
LKTWKKMESTLSEVNGKATTHTFSSADIVALSKHAEMELLALVGAQKFAPGATYTGYSGGSVANAYKYTRTGNCVEMVRRPAGWFLVGVSAITLWKTPHRDVLALSLEQDARAVEQLRARYVVAA